MPTEAVTQLTAVCVSCFHTVLKKKSLEVKLLKVSWQTNQASLMCILAGLTSLAVTACHVMCLQDG